VATVYCARWNMVLACPIDPVSEAAARRRFEVGPWFSVVLDGEDGAPRAVIELEPGVEAAKVFHFTPAGSIALIVTFRRDGDLLQLRQTDAYTYADDARHQQRELRVLETVLFRPDGTARRVVNDKSRPEIEVEDRSGVDVSDLALPVPSFGDWELLARWRSG
jgi:hypothetical protein